VVKRPTSTASAIDARRRRDVDLHRRPVSLISRNAAGTTSGRRYGGSVDTTISTNCRGSMGFTTWC
jgi:hypothetical protein